MYLLLFENKFQLKKTSKKENYELRNAIYMVKHMTTTFDFKAEIDISKKKKELFSKKMYKHKKK